MKSKRLFVSIDLPDSVKETLTKLDPNLRGIRWLRPEQMHLTLSFLGDVAEETEAKLRETLAAIKVAPFFLPVSGIGTFPARGWPKIIWIGVGSAHPHLFQLHKRVHDTALAAGLEPDLRPWHPHITLARCRDVSAESVRPFLKAHVDFEAGLIHVESFCLNSSLLAPNGSIYTRELVVCSL